jgi:hypothetical protein
MDAFKNAFMAGCSSIHFRPVMGISEVIEGYLSCIVCYIIAIQADVYTLPMTEFHWEFVA